jgi:ERCC4-related helicase
MKKKLILVKRIVGRKVDLTIVVENKCSGSDIKLLQHKGRTKRKKNSTGEQWILVESTLKGE